MEVEDDFARLKRLKTMAIARGFARGICTSSRTLTFTIDQCRVREAPDHFAARVFWSARTACWLW
jgi:hypothetical protein